MALPVVGGLEGLVRSAQQVAVSAVVEQVEEEVRLVEAEVSVARIVSRPISRLMTSKCRPKLARSLPSIRSVWM